MDRPEGPEYRDDGTIALVIGEDVVQLRRPKIGEFRKLIEAARQVADEVSDRAQRDFARQKLYNERLAELDEEYEPRFDDADSLEEAEAVAAELADEKQELRDRRRAIDREYQDWRDRQYLEWTLLAVSTLGQGELPAVDDLPSWMMSTQMQADMVEHWKAVPTRSGPRS